MAVLVSCVSYPTEQTQEVEKRLPEVMSKSPIPDYITMRGPYWDSDIEKGIQGFVIIEVEAAKRNEARARLAAVYSACHGIPGFKWNIKLWSEQKDIIERKEKYGS